MATSTLLRVHNLQKDFLLDDGELVTQYFSSPMDFSHVTSTAGSLTKNIKCVKKFNAASPSSNKQQFSEVTYPQKCVVPFFNVASRASSPLQIACCCHVIFPSSDPECVWTCTAVTDVCWKKNEYNNYYLFISHWLNYTILN